jgi:uncharacterized protein YnzC (UPF0291/DUF896 family)
MHSTVQWKSLSCELPKDQLLEELEKHEQDRLLREHISRLKKAWKADTCQSGAA